MAIKEKSKRQLQVGETIKRVVCEIFLRDSILTLPNSYVTVLEADISPDMKNVKIYIDIFGNESAHDNIVKALNKAAPHFRMQIAKKVNLRITPEVSFVLDKTERKAALIDRLIEAEAKKMGGDDE